MFLDHWGLQVAISVVNSIVFHVECMCLCISDLDLYSKGLKIGTSNSLRAICEPSGRDRPTRRDVHKNMSTSVFGDVDLI